MGLVRGGVLGCLLGLVAGPFGFALGAIAAPIALLEAEQARRPSPWTRALCPLLLWSLALLGCVLAYAQGVYASAAWAHGPLGGVRALLVEFERATGSEAQTIRIYLLCGALGYSGASLARLTSDVRPFLALGCLTGIAGTLLSPLADHGTWLDQLGASLLLVPCLAAGALPLWCGLWVFYGGVDRLVEAWESGRPKPSGPSPTPA